MYELAYYAKCMDIMTFSVGHPPNTSSLLRAMIRGRVIFGGFREEDFAKVQAMVTCTARPNLECRYLKSSHIKLFVTPGHAILGSANAGSGSEFELAVEYRRAAEVRNFQVIFDAYWEMAKPVKPLDLVSAKRILETSVFEVRGIDQTKPKPKQKESESK